MYAVVLGFLITLVVGYIASYVFYLLKLQNTDKIYAYGSSGEINADLFSPPIAKKLKKRFDKKQVT